MALDAGKAGSLANGDHSNGDAAPGTLTDASTVSHELTSRPKLESEVSQLSARAPGSLLSGRQEHYLKRELLGQQVSWEISELNTPTALQRFGAPFRSDYGEVAPVDSELPILRYIFVNHVRNFPFLDQAKEKEFWQDKLQKFLELFANKHISSSEDRLEETKRRKLAIKAKKLVELMMVSGIPTASGYEERIRFSEMEIVERGADETGLLVNEPEGQSINGWNVNVAAVRTTQIKRTEFILRVKKDGEDEYYVGRRYGDFSRLHKRLRIELPGKVLPPLPKKNKQHTRTTFSWGGGDDDDASSVSSVSTANDGIKDMVSAATSGKRPSSLLVSLPGTGSNSPRRSMDTQNRETPVVLYREEQRVSLRAFLRSFLQNEQIATSKAMEEFLAGPGIKVNEEEKYDIQRRKEMDAKRMEEQRQFYEVARQRARELDTYMEKFRRDIVESNGLSRLFAEIRQKDKIADLSMEYQKFAEWLRIEVAATLYHLFLAEDNSPELFAQAKRIHSMMPYVALKQVIRFANPALVMNGVLDLFLAQPFGSRSLAQRVFGLALNDGVKSVQKAIDALRAKIDEPVLCDKLKNFCNADEDIKNQIRSEAVIEDVDILVAILRSESLQPELAPEQIGQVFNAYVAWNNAVENIDDEMKQGAILFSQLKQLLKMCTRQRDKIMMQDVIEQPVTLQLLRDLFSIFYEPLIRVYKSANVYSSVTDFSSFADDAIAVIEKCQRQDVSADPNQTVQSFIDLCARHQDNFYKFVHEVHIHDNGLFTQLMNWLEGILEFLRHGPEGGALDVNALFQGAIAGSQIDKEAAISEINALIKWQQARKTWHQDKTRQKMAADNSANGLPVEEAPGAAMFRGSDFGLDEADLQEMAYESEDDEDQAESDDELDPIDAERKRRARQQVNLRRTAGEPVKPEIKEVLKLQDGFTALLRQVLAGNGVKRT